MAPDVAETLSDSTAVEPDGSAKPGCPKVESQLSSAHELLPIRCQLVNKTAHAFFSWLPCVCKQTAGISPGGTVSIAKAATNDEIGQSGRFTEDGPQGTQFASVSESDAFKRTRSMPSRPSLSTSPSLTALYNRTFTPDFASVFSRPMDPAPAPLVFINAHRGAGKHAVSECLTLLTAGRSLLLDAHAALAKPGHPQYDPSRRCGDRLARTLAKRANLHKTAILADCVPDTPAGRAAVRAYETAAAQSGRLFVPVELVAADGDPVSMFDYSPIEDDYGASAAYYAYSNGGSVSPSASLRLPTNDKRLCPAGEPRHRLKLCVSPAQAHEAALAVLEYVHELQIGRDVELASAVSTPMECGEPEWRHA